MKVHIEADADELPRKGGDLVKQLLFALRPLEPRFQKAYDALELSHRRSPIDSAPVMDDIIGQMRTIYDEEIEGLLGDIYSYLELP